MKLTHVDRLTGGSIHYIQNDPAFRQQAGDTGKLFTIAMNGTEDQQVWIDGIAYQFPARSLFTSFTDKEFYFEQPQQVVAWRFTREFYCIIDHDQEVGCAGFLFFGSFGNLFIHLDEAHWSKLQILQHVFIEEFNTVDSAQTNMLQLLLTRLIIITTRLAKEQHIRNLHSDTKFEVIRQFNLLVEKHFKSQHHVQFYASQLNRSSKTLSNVFAQAGHRSPLHIIHERILQEAKRLLLYSDKSAKEIAYELGFEDATHFSRFYKNASGQNITSFRKQLSPATLGKIVN